MEWLKPLVPIAINLIRYFLFAGIAWLVFYKWKRTRWFYMKIQQKFPENFHIRRDILYSLSTILIFGLITAFILWANGRGYTNVYKEVEQYGVWYIVFSTLLVIFIHDTWFYWTHRWMHQPKIFRIVHKVHHLSHNPSPWTAFAFHPLEALVEAVFFPIVVFILPLHPIALFSFMLFMIVMNVMGHTGYEYSPNGFLKHKVFRWFNTPTHHNMHHHLTKGNFGLYFNIWDRLMGTNHKDYEKVFDGIKRREK